MKIFKMNNIITATILSILLLSCSSLPTNQEQQPTSDTRLKAAEYAQTGNKHLNDGDFAMAITFFEMSRDLNLSVDHLEGVADSYNSLGKVYIAAGQYDTAEMNLNNGARVADPLGIANLTGRNLGLQGELALAKDDSEMAMDFFNQALTYLAEGSNNRAIVLHNQATSFKKQNQFDKAVIALTEAIKINESNSQFSELGANYYLLASLYSKQENYPQALENASKALENDKKVENSIGIAQDLFAFGRIYEKTNQWSEAHEYYLRAFLVYETMGIKVKMQSTLPYLINCAQQLGDEESVELYKKTQITLENL